MVLVVAKKNPPLLVTVMCVSLALAAVSARYSFFPVRAYYATKVVNTPANPTAEEDDAWIWEKAKETEGDIKKLSRAGRKRLDKITRGHGEMALHLYSRL